MQNLAALHRMHRAQLPQDSSAQAVLHIYHGFCFMSEKIRVKYSAGIAEIFSSRAVMSTSVLQRNVSPDVYGVSASKKQSPSFLNVVACSTL